MQRLFFIAGSLMALSACSGMDGMIKHHGGHYGDLAKIAKEKDAQHALLLTREGELVVVNVATGELVPPVERERAANEMRRDRDPQRGVETEEQRISDEELAEIKRKFDSTIKLEVVRGSVCINVAKQPPGQQWVICSPPYPKWW